MLRTRVLAFGLPLALAGASLGGCFSITSEGKRVIRETDSNTQRVTKLEQQQNAQLEQLRTAEDKAQQSIKQLEGVIEQATQVVQRNSADVVTQVSELQGKVASLEGRLAELQYAIDELKKAPAAAPAPIGATSGSATPAPAAADETPADKNEHYAAAYRAYSERDFTKARSLFKSFIERYGTDAQADNAQYWIGASYLVENRPATALAELKKVIQNFRGGDAVDEALLDMAEAFYRLRACSDSRNALDTLIRTQPNSPLVSKAKAKLKDMKSLAKDYCTS
jgi:TolA-binding protein